MKRQIQILIQHKSNNANAYAKVYESMCRIYGQAKVDKAIERESK
jgi:hypothetical protein